MAGQVKFLRKNHLDLDRPNPTIVITDAIATNNGQDSVNFLRNRNNISGWLTTDSTDAANTEILCELGDFLNIDHILLVKHNFKDFLIEYRDLFDVWQTYENVTANTDGTNLYTKTSPINADAVRITITAAQVVDADKQMRQLILAEQIAPDRL